MPITGGRLSKGVLLFCFQRFLRFLAPFKLRGNPVSHRVCHRPTGHQSAGWGKTGSGRMTFGLQSYFAMTSPKALESSVPQFPFLRWVEGDCGEPGDIMPIKHGAQCLGLGHGEKSGVLWLSAGSRLGLLSWELACPFPESRWAANLLEQSRGHTGAVRRQPHSPMRDGRVSMSLSFLIQEMGW